MIPRPGRKTLKNTAASHIADAEGRNAFEAASQARNVTAEFMALMKMKNKAYVDEIDRDDIFNFHSALRNGACVDRTVANKHTRLAL